MTVIDLGVVGAVPGKKAAPRPRRFLVLGRLIAVACLLTVTASAPPRPGPFTALWSIPLSDGLDQVQTAEDAIHVLRHGPPNQLITYSLRTGAIRSTITVPDEARIISETAGDVVLIALGATSPPSFGRETVAVDTATGRQLWRLPGAVTGFSDGLVLLSEWGPNARTVRTLRVVGLRDGAQAWSRSAPYGWVSTETDRGRVITVGSDGHAEVRALADGRLVAQAALPWTGTSRINARDGILVVENYDDLRQQNKVTVFDLATMRPQWAAVALGNGGIVDCGPVLCGYDGTGVSGWDRATGIQRWYQARTNVIYPLDGGRVGTSVGELGTDELVVLSAESGAVVSRTPRAKMVPSHGSATVYVLATTVTPFAQTAVWRLDQHTGGSTLLGLIGQLMDYSCDSRAELLICATADARLVTLAYAG
ncbi:PQQ-binding-like beta-propeller repeat protein [Winogradskya humida]|uniref:Pyrroloquinoline-quinone binding quinoprotein n=1 Tax=Winogradskya humida TaxID=113566 RepID=A0ABQ3ZW73_9ACTN|nr:PQQ-binding-like beta-propeller repeat protein [Actinoplanes humidus]GIE22866.1 hypothetical protein Ahu01nite_059680 [Actinoplanes humidus]